MKKIKKNIKDRLYNRFFRGFVKPNYSDFSDFEMDVVHKSLKFSLTGPFRILSLIRATDYIVKNDIKGSIVECGVWKGGSIMAVLSTLLKHNINDKKVYLYDTYEGMSTPTENDKSVRGEDALNAFEEKDEVWDKIKCYSSLEEVKENVYSTGYNAEKLNFIKGKVEDTITKDNLPEEISILRLDTDWYESTKHELEFLYPKLVKGGILIIDDYGHWDGCKKAVDEYFKENNINMFLSRIDYSCRIGVKC